MCRIVSGIDSLQQHIATLRSTPEVYLPRCCPSCGHGGLWHHGCYFRKADRRPEPMDECLNPIPIPRYLCSSCRHSCSRLPSCIAPRRWYSWLSQQQALQSLLAIYSLRGCSAAHGLCDVPFVAGGTGCHQAPRPLSSSCEVATPSGVERSTGSRFGEPA